MKKILEFAKKHIKLIILAVVLIVVTIKIISVVAAVKNAVAELDDVRTDMVVRQDISNYVSMTGTIVANDSQTVYATQTGVEVLEVNVKVGDVVKEGDIIAVLDSSELLSQLETAQNALYVERAKTALRVQRAAEDVQDAQVDGLDSWKENDINLAQAQTDYSYAQADVTRACEDLSKARADLARAIEDLEDDYDDAKKAKKEAKEDLDAITDETTAEYKAAKNTYDAAKDKEKELKEELEDTANARSLSSYNNAVLSAERGVEEAQRSLEKTQRTVEDTAEKRADSAENQRRKILDAQQAQQETNLDASIATDSSEDKIKDLQKQIDNCTVTAPISGVVTSVSMEEGNTATNDKNTICVIQDTSCYEVEATVDEYDVAKITEGMEAAIKTEATEDMQMSGKVDFVSPTPKSSDSGSTSSTVAYPVKILIDEIDDAVRIGMTATANVLLETAKDVMTVPYDCVAKNDNGDYVVYAVQEGDADKVQNVAAGKGGLGLDKRSMGKNANGDMAGARAEGVANRGKEIVVSVGLITDYYVEISSPELTDGMEIYVPDEGAISLDDEREEEDMHGRDMGPGGGW